MQYKKNSDNGTAAGAAGEQNPAFVLSHIACAEGPLEFRSLMDDEHFDCNASLVVGPVSLTFGGLGAKERRLNLINRIAASQSNPNI